MKSLLENRLSMLVTVVIVCDKLAAVLMSIPALWTNILAYKDRVVLVEDMVQNQIKQIDGITKAKKKAQLRLIELAVIASGMLKAYANDIDDLELSRRIKMSRSKLKHTRDELVYDSSKIIIDTMAGLVSEMGPYGLTPQLMSDMQASLTNYHNKMEEPAEARANRKYYTKQLSILTFDAIKWLRESIDGNIEVLLLTRPDVVEKYKNARMVYDYSAGRKKQVIEIDNPAMLSGAVTDGQGFPVADANVIIEDTKIHTSTDIDGEYFIDNLPAGVYNVIISLDGYAEVRENKMAVGAGDDIVKDFVIELAE